ncbi:MAG: TonB-dependent receptor [Bacteroidales bacterium]|nr:TonB-dependent receptor [Bacteroidales bacterium]MBR6731965.1 TonB-dependent receptor [Bacteroidales bacterium]
MKSKLFTCLALLLLSMSLMAQTKKVSGTVVDEMGPVAGVSVIEKGTQNGAVTDLDGKYSINVPQGATLVITSIGYKDVELLVGSQNVYNATLQEDRQLLDEVVVVGYGTMKRSDLSGASVSMSEESIKGSIVSSLDQTLQGRAAGVTAVQTSGAPGSSSSIRVRGQATINANAEPLYVIDGVIVQGGGNSGADFGLGDALGNGKVSTISPLSTINPADIVSMEILKDASATAIYGAQGANGVILITTKRGKAGEAKFTYDGMFAFSQQTRRVDMMNLREYAEYYNDLASIGEIYNPSAYYSDPSLLGVGTNWQDAVFQTALQHSHQISASGGTEKVQYYVSGSYMDQEGTIIGSNFERFSVRTNLDAQLKKWLKLGVNATFSNTVDDLKLADGEAGIVFSSLTTIPDIPIYDVDGNFSTVVREGYTNVNPVALAMMDDIILKRQKLTGSIFADVNPIKHLTWHTELGFDIGHSKSETYEPMVDLGNWQRGNNETRWQNNTNMFWQLKNYLTYAQTIGKHSFSAMVGHEMWESSWENQGIYNTKLPSDEVHNPSLGAGTPTINSGFGSASMASVFTRETYNYDQRYYVTYTYRYDGSSNFGPANRWAGFHSAAASWRFTNEPWMKDLDWWSNGKLRLGWGQTGNSNIGGYAWGSSIVPMDSALGAGYRPGNIANESVRWESQEQYNIGLDLGFFQDRLNLVVDLYQKTSRDMLMSMQLPSYMGTQGNGSSVLSAPKGNYGSIENRGLEITLDVHPFVGEFQWDSNFQISFNQNTLKALTGTTAASIVGYGQWSDVVCVSEIGKSLYNFYGYEVEGVYESLQDILDSPKTAKHPEDGVFNRSNTVWVGDLKYKDQITVDTDGDGVLDSGDGVIDENDRVAIGSPLPKFTFGWNNTFRYKGFDLNIFLNGSYGNKVLNYSLMNGPSGGLASMRSAWVNQNATAIKDRAQLAPIDPDKVYENGGNWYDDISNVKVVNSGTKTPRPTLSDPNDNDRLSTRYIEDGSYLRIKNLTLGYTFPKKWMNKIKFDNIRIYCNIQNLYTFTKYSGYDPEVGASTQDATGYTYGVDNGRYPSPTTYSFGVSLTF